MALSNFLRVHFITRHYIITKEAIRRGFSLRRVQKALRTRTANRLVEDSRIRGGSANIRDDRARARIARRSGDLAQVLQTVQVTIIGRKQTRSCVILIVFMLNEIFEDMEMTI